MFRRLWLAAGLAVVCTTVSAKKPDLPSPIADHLVVEILRGPQELAVEVPATASAMGAQFGLIGSIIGASIQNSQVKSAENASGPLRDLLIDYGFDARLEAALRAKLPSQGISPAPDFVALDTPWAMPVAGRDLAGMPARALVIAPTYTMDYGFGTLRVSMDVALQDRAVTRSNRVRAKNAFQRTYTWNMPLQGATPGPQAWTGFGTARLTALIDEGIGHVVDLMVHDFSSAGRAQWNDKVKWRDSAMLKGVSYPGLGIREHADWVWVRAGSGILQTLQGYRPVSLDLQMPGATTPDSQIANSAAAPDGMLPAEDAGATPMTLEVSGVVDGVATSATPPAATQDPVEAAPTAETP